MTETELRDRWAAAERAGRWGREQDITFRQTRPDECYSTGGHSPSAASVRWAETMAGLSGSGFADCPYCGTSAASFRIRVMNPSVWEIVCGRCAWAGQISLGPAPRADSGYTLEGRSDEELDAGLPFVFYTGRAKRELEQT